MIWFVIGALIVARFRLLTVSRAAFIIPASMLLAYAVKPSTLTALGVWAAALIVAALLWQSDRG